MGFFTPCFATCVGDAISPLSTERGLTNRDGPEYAGVLGKPNKADRPYPYTRCVQKRVKMSNIVQFVTSQGFSNLKEAVDSLGKATLEAMYADYAKEASTNVKPAPKPEHDWKSELFDTLVSFVPDTGKKKGEKVSLFVRDSMKVLDGSEHDKGTVVGINALDGAEIRVAPYYHREGSGFRTGKQATYTLATLDKLNAVALEMLSGVTPTVASTNGDSSEFSPSYCDSLTTVAEVCKYAKRFSIEPRDYNWKAGQKLSTVQKNLKAYVASR